MDGDNHIFFLVVNGPWSLSMASSWLVFVGWCHYISYGDTAWFDYVPIMGNATPVLSMACWMVMAVFWIVKTECQIAWSHSLCGPWANDGVDWLLRRGSYIHCPKYRTSTLQRNAIPQTTSLKSDPSRSPIFSLEHDLYN